MMRGPTWGDTEEALYEGANLEAEGLALASLEVGLAVLDRDGTIRAVHGHSWMASMYSVKSRPIRARRRSRCHDDQARPRSAVESSKLGVNRSIVKPVDFDPFIEAVREIGFYWRRLNPPPRKK
jgi:hypothetical protein